MRKKGRTREEVIFELTEENKNRRSLWTKEELQYLIDNYQTHTIKDFCNALPNHGIYAIEDTCQKLRLFKEKRQFFPNLFNRHPDSENFFEKWSPKMAYVLGWITTDGCINNNRIMFNIQERDIHILKDMSNAIFDEDISFIRKRKSSIKRSDGKEFINMAHLEINNHKMVSDLYNLGISKAKTYKVKPPLNIPENCIRSYLRGLIDGDGYIGVNTRNNLVVKYIGNIYMTTFFRNFVNDLTGSKLKLSSDKYYDGRDLNKKIYYLTYSCKKAENFLTFLYNDPYCNLKLNRKYLIYKNFMKEKYSKLSI